MYHPFSPMPEVFEALKNGEIVIVLDDENRENEGDFLMLADKATPEKVNFMITHGRGLVCVPLEKATAERLQLSPMVTHNNAPLETAFTIAVDAKHGTSTGISSFDRALTIGLLADPMSSASDFVRPGHVFPLIAKKGGVLERSGHTEAAVDFAKILGANPAGVICEILGDKGLAANFDELCEMHEKFQLKMTTVEALIHYRLQTECHLSMVSRAKLPTRYGEFDIFTFGPDFIELEQYFKFNELFGLKELIVLTTPDFKFESTKTPMVRVHSECATGDLFGSLRCDCGEQLQDSLRMIHHSGYGLVIYLRQEGRSIGLSSKLSAYDLQEQGFDTVDANLMLGHQVDQRDFRWAQQALSFFQIKSIQLLTNNPDKVAILEKLGIEVKTRLPLERISTEQEHNHDYLSTKKNKLGHYLKLNEGTVYDA